RRGGRRLRRADDAGARSAGARTNGNSTLAPSPRHRDAAQAHRDRVGRSERLPRADHVHTGPERRDARDQPRARLRAAAAVDLGAHAAGMERRVTADQRRRTVQASYDELGWRFAEWGERIEGDPWER